MAKKSFVRRIYRRVGRRMGRTTIPVMGVVSAGALACSVLASSGGVFDPRDTPLKLMKDGKWDYVPLKIGFNLSKFGTYVPVILPLAVWGLGRAFLGKVRVSRKVSLF